MKRVRPKAHEADEATAEEAMAAPPRPERPAKTSLLRECWADLRGRPRPSQPVWEEEPSSKIETGGIGIDDVGFRRMETRYANSSGPAGS